MSPRKVRRVNGVFALGLAVGFASPAIGAEFRAVIPHEHWLYVGYWNDWRIGFAMSGDGWTIAGGEPSAAPGGLQAYRWRPSTGVQWIPLPAPHLHDDWDGCTATAVNRDGSKIAIVCQVDEHDALPGYPVKDVLPFAFENGVLTPWTRLNDSSTPLDMTPLGSMAVGHDFEYHSWTLNHDWRAVYWDAGGQIHQLDPLDGGNCDAIGADDDARAAGVSDDGRIIVGVSGDFFYPQYQRPVVWVDGVVEPLNAFGPECGSKVVSIQELSGDGRFAVGSWWHANGTYKALVWDVGLRSGSFLPFADPSDNNSYADCISQDGALIGGSSGGWPLRAVLWDRETSQVTYVSDLLTNLGLGSQIAGWQLSTVARMSRDGKRIAGRGIDPGGQPWIWWADLTDPPKNDSCTNATTLVTNTSPYLLDTQSHTIGGTTRDASWDGGASCASTAHENTNIWYKFTAPVDGYLMLDLCDSPLGLLDEYLSEHTGCPGTAANEILCVTDCPHRRDCDWPCVAPPELFIPAGQTRYIQIGGWADDGHDVVLGYRFLPLNDDCADAFSVGHDPSSTPGSTEDMTVDTGADCQGITATAPGVWYAVLGTGTTMTASTCGPGGGANFDTKISVFCSGCGGMTCVGANDDSTACSGTNGLLSSVSWCASAGTLYHILVHGYQAQTGIFDLAVTDNGQPCSLSINCHPANETCAQAIPVSEGTILSDNTDANTSGIGASCAASTNDVWFYYRARCDAQLWVDTCQLGLGSIGDSVVSFYDGCSGAQLACNDDYSDATINCQNRSVAIGAVSQDQDILIRVAGYGLLQLNQGTFPLRVTEVPAPLQILSGPVMPDGTLGVPYAFQIAHHGGCGRRFTTATGLPPGLSVDLFSGLVSGTPLSAGDFSVHVEVASGDLQNPEWVEDDLTLRIWPTNDDCAGALTIGEGLHYFGNAGATTDGPNEPIMCMDGSGDTQVGSDVWYRYTSSCDGRATFDLCDSDYDTKMAIYQGPNCPTGPGAIACNDDECYIYSWLNIPVAVGAEYLIRIGGYHGAQGAGRLLVTCINDCDGNSINDSEELAAGTASDCNHNGLPDVCDVRGDANADGALDLSDWPAWLACLWGPCGPGGCTPGIYADSCCAWFDLDGDGDIDLADFRILEVTFDEPTVP